VETFRRFSYIEVSRFMQARPSLKIGCCDYVFISSWDLLTRCCCAETFIKLPRGRDDRQLDNLSLEQRLVATGVGSRVWTAVLHFAQVRNACLLISTFRQLISIADRLTKELSSNGGISKFPYSGRGFLGVCASAYTFERSK